MRAGRVVEDDDEDAADQAADEDMALHGFPWIELVLRTILPENRDLVTAGFQMGEMAVI